MFNWGPRNGDFLALNDRDIEKEHWANYFFNLITHDRGEEAEESVRVLEAHGDEAFAEFVAETQRLADEEDARGGPSVAIGDEPKRP